MTTDPESSMSEHHWLRGAFEAHGRELHAQLPAGASRQPLGRPLDWRTIPSSANGRPALIGYLRRESSPDHDALVVDILRVMDGKIAEINAFVGARHAMAFGLPVTLEGPAHRPAQG